MTLPPTDLPDSDLGRLRPWIDEHRRQMVDDLRRYVSMETPSTDRDLLAAGLAWLRGWLRQGLGQPASEHVVDGGTYGDICVQRYPGDGRRSVAVLCHYDTVWPAGTLADWPFSVDGDIATGPGVFDMKAGLVQAVWALRALAALGLDRPAVNLVLNGDEEIGSLASRSVIEETCAASDATLVFEPSAAGAVKTARKGIGIYELRARGVAAHAGLDPHKGASAVTEIVHAVLAVLDLADPGAGTTVNVGTLTGGTRTNVIAEHATAGVDVRAATVAEADRVDRAIHALSARDARVELSVDGGLNRPVMERTPAIAGMYRLARTLAQRIGLDLPEAAVGGGSDGNFAAVRGLPVLDGLGAVGAGAHAAGEHVSLDGMVERTALAAAVIHALA